MCVRELELAPRLGEFIDRVVHVEIDHPAGAIVPLSPRPAAGITIRLPPGLQPEYLDSLGNRWRAQDAVLLGPQSRRNYNIVSPGYYAALTILFQPTGLHRLFRLSPNEIADGHFDACDVLGPDFRGFVNAVQALDSLDAMRRLTEQLFLSRAEEARSANAVTHVASIMQARRAGGDLGALAQSTGISDRQLERQFREQVGMSPKRYERLVRFRRALQFKANASDMSWTRVTYEAGYYDQNHLIRDFRDLTGCTPSAYLRAILPTRASEMFETRQESRQSIAPASAAPAAGRPL